jgi:hypothetical protein
LTDFLVFSNIVPVIIVATITFSPTLFKGGIGVRMKMFIWAMGIVLFSVWTTPAIALYQRLTQEQIDEAIKFGKRHVNTDTIDFLREWGMGLGPDKGDAIIITEFLALALAARDYAARGGELDRFEIEDTLAKSSGKLVFRVTTYGNSMDFAKEYTAYIKPGGKIVPATYWTNSDGEPYGDGKTKPAFVADSDFFFPSEGIDPSSSLTLTVQDHTGKPVAQFQFDLKKIR